MEIGETTMITVSEQNDNPLESHMGETHFQS